MSKEINNVVQSSNAFNTEGDSLIEVLIKNWAKFDKHTKDHIGRAVAGSYSLANFTVLMNKLSEINTKEESKPVILNHRLHLDMTLSKAISKLTVKDQKSFRRLMDSAVLMLKMVDSELKNLSLTDKIDAYNDLKNRLERIKEQLSINILVSFHEEDFLSHYSWVKAESNTVEILSYIEEQVDKNERLTSMPQYN